MLVFLVINDNNNNNCIYVAPFEQRIQSAVANYYYAVCQETVTLISLQLGCAT